MVHEELKKFGMTTVYQVVNEGVGDVGIRSVQAKRPKIWGVDTYVLANLGLGAVIGIVGGLKLQGEAKTAAEIVGAGLFAKGLVQLGKQLTAPATGLPVIVRPTSLMTGGNGAIAAAPAVF